MLRDCRTPSGHISPVVVGTWKRPGKTSLSAPWKKKKKNEISVDAASFSFVVDIKHRGIPARFNCLPPNTPLCIIFITVPPNTTTPLEDITSRSSTHGFTCRTLFLQSFAVDLLFVAPPHFLFEILSFCYWSYFQTSRPTRILRPARNAPHTHTKGTHYATGDEEGEGRRISSAITSRGPWRRTGA